MPGEIHVLETDTRADREQCSHEFSYKGSKSMMSSLDKLLKTQNVLQYSQLIVITVDLVCNVPCITAPFNNFEGKIHVEIFKPWKKHPRRVYFGTITCF